MKLFNKNRNILPTIKIPVNLPNERFIYDLMEVFKMAREGKIDRINARLNEKATEHDAAMLKLAQESLHLNSQNFFTIFYELYTSLNSKKKASFSRSLSSLLSYEGFMSIVDKCEVQITALYLNKYYPKLSYSKRKYVKSIVISCNKTIKSVYEKMRASEDRIAEYAASSFGSYTKRPCFERSLKAILIALSDSISQELATIVKPNKNRIILEKSTTQFEARGLRI